MCDFEQPARRAAEGLELARSALRLIPMAHTCRAGWRFTANAENTRQIAENKGAAVEISGDFEGPTRAGKYRKIMR